MKVKSNTAAKSGLNPNQIGGELILATVKEVATVRRDDVATGALVLHAGVLFTKTVKMLAARCQVDRLPDSIAAKIRKVCQDFAGMRLEALKGDGWELKRESEIRVKLNKADGIHEGKRLEMVRLCEARQQVKHGRFEIIRLKEMLSKAQDIVPKTKDEKAKLAETVSRLEARVKRWQDAVNKAMAELNAASVKGEAKAKPAKRHKAKTHQAVTVSGGQASVTIAPPEPAKTN